MAAPAHRRTSCGHLWPYLVAACPQSLPGDGDALERKRAAVLLQRLLPASQLASPGWALWQALYDLLDDFPLHLVAPMWQRVSQHEQYIVHCHLAQCNAGSAADLDNGTSIRAAAPAPTHPPIACTRPSRA